VTNDAYIDMSANAMSHGPEPSIESLTVDDIMRERKVGKRYAYEILKRLSEEQNLATAVPDNQRERVLAVLYKTGARDTNALKDALHRDGYEVDGHDTTKVMWSLQKTGHVKFRERQSPRMLYAIKLTDKGRQDGRKYLNGKKREDPPTEERSPVNIDADRITPPEEYAVSQPEPEPVVDRPAAYWVDHPEEWPAINDLRERAAKAQKLGAAAKILEEVGEDDMVLALMGKTEFTPLEREVIDILDHYQELLDLVER
jgi:hypothetical protein